MFFVFDLSFPMLANRNKQAKFPSVNISPALKLREWKSALCSNSYVYNSSNSSLHGTDFSEIKLREILYFYNFLCIRACQ